MAQHTQMPKEALPTGTKCEYCGKPLTSPDEVGVHRIHGHQIMSCADVKACADRVMEKERERKRRAG